MFTRLDILALLAAAAAAALQPPKAVGKTGTSLKFALDLVDQLYGPEKAEELRAQMLVD